MSSSLKPFSFPAYSPLPGIAACKPAPLSMPSGQAVLEAEELHFRYSDDSDAVAGVSFRVMPVVTVALCGHNGSGKTTLMKMLAVVSAVVMNDEGHDPGLDHHTADPANSVRTVFWLVQHRVLTVAPSPLVGGCGEEGL